MVNIALCDDEPFMLEAAESMVSGYMKEHNYAFDCAKFLCGKELLAHTLNFDIIFLDIQMSPPNGMETARHLREKGFDGIIIFLTVMKEMVFESFEVRPFDYIIKPLEKKRFTSVMERALKSIENTNSKSLSFKNGGFFSIIPFSKILYCEILGRKVYIHQSNGAALDFYGRISDLENRFDGRFFRCHRSYIVNLDFVSMFGGGLITLENGEKVPVSRLRGRELAAALLLRMKDRGQ